MDRYNAPRAPKQIFSSFNTNTNIIDKEDIFADPFDEKKREENSFRTTAEHFKTELKLPEISNSIKRSSTHTHLPTQTPNYNSHTVKFKVPHMSKLDFVKERGEKYQTLFDSIANMKQQGIIKFLLAWFKQNYEEDFSNNKLLMNHFLIFIRQIDNKRLNEKIDQISEEEQSKKFNRIVPRVFSNIKIASKIKYENFLQQKKLTPETIVQKQKSLNSLVTRLDLLPLENVVLQIIYFDCSIFASIKKVSLVDKVYLSENKNHDLSSVFQRSRDMANWVVNCLLGSQTLERAHEIFNYFLNLSKMLYDSQNFFSCHNILRGLCHKSIKKLHVNDCMFSLTQNEFNSLIHLLDLMSYEKYRSHIYSIEDPQILVIPSFEYLLREVLIQESSEPDCVLKNDAYPFLFLPQTPTFTSLSMEEEESSFGNITINFKKLRQLNEIWKHAEYYFNQAQIFNDKCGIRLPNDNIRFFLHFVVNLPVITDK